MKWTKYEEDIVQARGVYISGWPKEIPFANLSVASSGKPELAKLLTMWQDGSIQWLHLNSKEKAERQRKLEVCYALGKMTMPKPHKSRSDKGVRKRVSESDDDEDSGAPPSQKTKQTEFIFVSGL